MAKILVVDDRPSNRQFLTTLLGYGGHRMLEAEDGAQALGLVRSERPELVITDILMPSMDGYEFVQQVRADPEVAPTPIIFYTATYSTPQAEALARSCGVSKVLPKPSEPQEIILAVNQALGVSGQDDVPPAVPETLGTTAHEPIDKTLDIYSKDLEEVRLKFEKIASRGTGQRGGQDAVKELSQKFAENVAAMQRITARLSALLEVGMEMMAERDPARLVELFFAAACDVVDSEYAAVGMLDEKEQAIRHVFAKGFDAGIVGGEAGRKGLLGSLLSGRRVLLTRSPEGAERLPKDHPPVRNLLGIPVASGERIYGWIYFAGRRGQDGFSEEDTRLAAVMAARLAVLYENAVLYDEIQRHAAELQIEMTERRRAQAALAESEAGLRRAQLMAKLAQVITGPEGGFESWSDTLPPLIGVDPAQMPASTREWLDILHPDDRPLFRAKAIGGGVTRARTDVEYRLRRSNGEWIHIRQAMEPMEGGLDTAGRLRWFNTLQDVTEQKQAEIKIRRLNRVYTLLSHINGLIVRVRDRDELYREACRIAVEAGKFLFAWVAVVDRDALQLRPVARAGDDKNFLADIQSRLSLGESGSQGQTIVARAALTKQAMISNDVANDPRIVFKDEHVKLGTGSLAVLPLIVSSEVAGIFTLHSAERGFFDDEETKLLNELAGDISFALDHIKKAEKLDYLAYYDALTGLANSTLFRERLEQHIVAAANAQRSFAVVVVNVNRFREVNNAFGRQAGDELLKQIADRFAVVPVDSNRLARIGADHFAYLGTTAQSEEEVARRTDRRLKHWFGSPYRVGANELRVSVTAGIAVFPNDGTGGDELLKNAEAALKKAKATGERYLFFEQRMTERIAENLSLENKLRQALEREEFVLHYQPKVELETRRIVGVEALIRWQSPELGLVPPGRFIPLLEETGLILEVGSWALTRAALDHRAWVEARIKPPRVAVNVSAIQLRQRDFVDIVERAVMEGMAPVAIDLEITESLIMENVEATIEKLKKVQALGIKIAIDDFGTGYSSLAYLARLPVETLKIDRSFVITMLNDPDTATLVQTIITLAHSLKLTVVAEGVDSEEQAKVLRLLRCDQMQGYLFSKPLPRDEVTVLLKTRT